MDTVLNVNAVAGFAVFANFSSFFCTLIIVYIELTYSCTLHCVCSSSSYLPLNLVSEMTYYASSGTLNPTHSLTFKTNVVCIFMSYTF